MRELVALEFTSLDGVVQAPMYPDEDPSGGFAHGGWHARYFDPTSMQWVVDTVASAGAYVLGRGTYELFAAHFPHASEDEQVLAQPLNSRPKYVASRTLSGSLAWPGAVLLPGDAVAALARLKHEGDDRLVAIGSPGLVRSLLETELVDELRLMVSPVVLGGGKRLLRDGGKLRRFELRSCTATGSGALLSSYGCVRA